MMTEAVVFVLVVVFVTAIDGIIDSVRDYHDFIEN